jgi:[ribosomal protein S5]-alanine N-acetyltransferase
MIETQRLFLVPSTAEMMHSAVEEDWPTLSRLLGGVDFADQWSHFPEAMLWMRDRLQDEPGESIWWNYLIILRSEARLIGTCGYKGPPEPDGSVEIGYEIADAYQSRGFATEAARALLEWALAQPGVSFVKACTLAEENPSVHLLRRLGFVFTEEKIDIEDGKLWEWKHLR